MAKYFKKSEFDCKCGCGLNNIKERLVAKIDWIREKIGMPMVVRSGCRCESHNLSEGGKLTSDHLTGEGVDIKAISSHTRFLILFYAILIGFRRIGVGRTFIHLGLNEDNPQEVLWLY